jgi:hypothetical protein
MSLIINPELLHSLFATWKLSAKVTLAVQAVVPVLFTYVICLSSSLQYVAVLELVKVLADAQAEVHARFDICRPLPDALQVFLHSNCAACFVSPSVSHSADVAQTLPFSVLRPTYFGEAHVLTQVLLLISRKGVLPLQPPQIKPDKVALTAVTLAYLVVAAGYPKLELLSLKSNVFAVFAN